MAKEERDLAFDEFGSWFGAFAWSGRRIDLPNIPFIGRGPNFGDPASMELTSLFALAEDRNHAGALVIDTTPAFAEAYDLTWDTAYDEADWHLDDAFRTLVNISELGRHGLDTLDQVNGEAHLGDGRTVRLGRGFTETLIRLRSMLPGLRRAAVKRSGHLEATDMSRTEALTVTMDRRWLDDLDHGIRLLIG